MEVNSLNSGSVAQQIVGANETTNKAQTQAAAQKAVEAEATKAELPTSVLDGESTTAANADPAVDQAPPPFRGQNVDVKA